MTLPRLLMLCVLALTQAGCAGNPGCGSPGDGTTCTRVLFIGDSYTSVNDLPTVFADLAWSGGHRVDAGMDAPGGDTLTEHAADPATAAAIALEQWNIVVLQEQSQRPSNEQLRQTQMYPAVRQLDTAIRADGAQPMYFLGWARRDGWPEAGLPDYASMQSAIDDGYLTIATEEHAAVAPVGYAWAALLGQDSPSDLWQADGIHPTTTGTYLAACVFYAAIFKQSPEGLGYHADLSDDAAARVQNVAATAVLADPREWGL